MFKYYDHTSMRVHSNAKIEFYYFLVVQVEVLQNVKCYCNKLKCKLTNKYSIDY